MLTKKLLTEINERPRERRNLWQFVALGAGAAVLAALLLSSTLLALAVFAAGALCVWLVYKRDKAGQTTSLVYDDLDTETGARFAAVQEALEDLASSEKVWRVTEPRDRASKPGAGAAPTSDRRRVEVGRLETPGICANVAIWGIDADEMKVFFFPEAVLLYRQERYRAVSYESFEVALSSTRYVEEEEVPKDAEVVGRTWRFTREDGSKDLRYKPNPQLPLVLYGLLRVTGPSGLDMSLRVSNRAAATRFARAFGARVREERAREEPPRKEPSGSEGQEKARRSAQSRAAERTKAEPPACEVLGVADGASTSEINAAYRDLARIYHPDKVANLAPEIREFAHNKMKEINAAYAELKRQRKQRPTVFDGEPANGKKGEKRW